jgi:hypothetical protein
LSRYGQLPSSDRAPAAGIAHPGWVACRAATTRTRACGTPATDRTSRARRWKARRAPTWPSSAVASLGWPPPTTCSRRSRPSGCAYWRAKEALRGRGPPLHGARRGHGRRARRRVVRPGTRDSPHEEGRSPSEIRGAIADAQAGLLLAQPSPSWKRLGNLKGHQSATTGHLLSRYQAKKHPSAPRDTPWKQLKIVVSPVRSRPSPSVLERRQGLLGWDRRHGVRPAEAPRDMSEWMGRKTLGSFNPALLMLAGAASGTLSARVRNLRRRRRRRGAGKRRPFSVKGAGDRAARSI